jgi:hypothetical protein
LDVPKASQHNYFFRLFSERDHKLIGSVRFYPDWWCWVLIEFTMVAHEKLTAVAEEKMNTAQAALLAYVTSKEHDPALQKSLIDEVNRAIDDYEKLLDDRDKGIQDNPSY